MADYQRQIIRIPARMRRIGKKLISKLTADFTVWCSLGFIIVVIFFHGHPCFSEELAKGDVKYNSCHQLPIHVSPSSFSKIVTFLAYGSKVTIVDIEPVKTKSETPSWIKIKSEDNISGYSYSGCLISESLMKKQNEGRGEVNKEDAQGTVKHFSESEEKVDLYAMKGGVGSAKTGKADYSKLNAVLKAPMEKDTQSLYRNFRQEGKIAEFKQTDMKPGETSAPILAQNKEAASDQSIPEKDRSAKEEPPKEETKLTPAASDSPAPAQSNIRDSGPTGDIESPPAGSIHEETVSGQRMYPLSFDEIYQLLKAYRNKNPGRCLEFCQWAIDINPQYAPIYNERGYAYASLGDYPKACESFQSAEKLGDIFGIKWAKSKGLCQ